MTHTHHKWPCPKSNGRHEWEWDYKKLDEGLWKSLYVKDNKLSIPVRCAYGCGAYGIEYYKFKEIIEGE